MSPLERTIAQLPDARAIRALKLLTEAQARQGGFETQATDELRAAIDESVTGEQAPVPSDVADGELARSALLALSEIDAVRPQVEALVRGPAVETYATPELILSVGAVLVALQIGWRIQSKDGKKAFVKNALAGKHFVEFAGKLFSWLKKAD